MKHFLLALLFVAASVLCVAAQDTPEFLHSPTISRSQIVFVYADELWSVSRQGGAAHLLTSGPGVKSSPALSPDGRWFAFSLQDQGNVDVYVMPAEGGVAKRLTYHPTIDDVVGWTPDSKHVLFRSNRNSYSRFNRLFTVALDGGLPFEVPLPMAETGSYSADGSHLAYVPFTNARRLNAIAWRRYRGGNAARVWIARMSDSEIVKVPREDSQDWDPMWIGDKVYFISDRHDGIAGLYVYDTKTRDVKELVHPERDIKNAAATNDAIVYEEFGSLHLYDITSGKDEQLQVRCNGDLPDARPHFVKGADQIQAFNLSPSGARAVFDSHGEVLTVPREKGDIRNMTNTTGINERDPAWSPDGKSIAYFSDESGEYALHVRPANGFGDVKKYSLGESPSFYYSPLWSPDSKKIAYSDKHGSLWYLDLTSSKTAKIDTNEYRASAIESAWSPDSRWIAYTNSLSNYMHAVYIYSLENGKTQQVTDGMSDASHPAFDANGKYLYFLASTDNGPTIGGLDLSSNGHAVTSAAYIMVLSRQEPSPLFPQSDDEKAQADVPQKDSSAAQNLEEAKAQTPEAEDAKAAKSKPKNVVVKVDFENIGQRILALPLPPANYIDLFAGKEKTVFVVEAPPVQAGGPGARTAVFRFDLDSRKPERLWEGVSSFTVSFDGKRVLYSKRQRGEDGDREEKWFIDDATRPAAAMGGVMAASASPDRGAKELKLDAMEIYIDPRSEWAEMFNDVGREERDFFYDPGLHGLDWKETLAAYRPYLKSVSTRQDLSYLFADMLGNITVGHMYIRSPFTQEPKPVKTGLLGADYQIVNGHYRFWHIYHGENWNPQLRAPLTEPGVVVDENDYLLEVNGRELKGSDNIFELFQGTAGKTVTLKVGPDPGGKGAHSVQVVPIESETSLRNRAWMDANRRKVDELSGGKLAYIYLPDTANGGYTNFNRYFYSQVGKQGAVIDERFNGGGKAADYVIDQLRQPLMSYWLPRDGKVFTTPNGAIFGPKVMIINEHAGSGGDAMPWYFREAKLGPLVGTRTWGGLVGIGGTPSLMDGGAVTSPNFAFYSPAGKWEIENHGVAPDVEVEFDPAAWRRGEDPQLEKAVAVAMQELKEHPLPEVNHPPFPIYNVRTAQQPARSETKSGAN
ncbi:MAG TPA: PDZ domain-containing protein [Terriglobales bacterium]|nr:PDZ domain-containing protein [Terriglobales bacterium]